jgi:vitellogenic carboxypeptidase-like protein
MALYALLASAAPALIAAGKPLVVTPLLPHRFSEAQAASRVRLPGYNATDLFSGFFEIDAATTSRTFFLFSKAASGREDAPVLLWLNGGPGASSLIGFLTELGPFSITEGLDIEQRPVHWNLDAHLLALDNPLGTGFSSTADERRMATNQTTVGADLHAALEQFFTLFPSLRANPFYATGESYAGAHACALPPLLYCACGQCA